MHGRSIIKGDAGDIPATINQTKRECIPRSNTETILPDTGSVSHQIICFTDLLATFAGITGYKLREGEAPDSHDFSPVLLGKQSADRPVRPPLVMRSGAGLMTIREGDWKLIDGLGSGGFSQPQRVQPGPGDPEGQLYNLSDDPGETKNLYAEHPAVVERLRKALRLAVAEE